jgi:hypothetical protein
MTCLGDSANCKVVVAKGGLVVMRIDGGGMCGPMRSSRVAVNHRRGERGEPPVLALMLIGHY